MSSIDTLSDDVIICHILSFLPTRTSASTSVLARRWRFLWTQVQNLYFEGSDFEDESQASDIIHRVMAVHGGVRYLYLDFINPNYVVESFTPPRCLLTCTTLVDLKLRHCRGFIPSPGGNIVFLPSLKKLHLSRIMYENDESLPRLLSGCPVLEDLILEACFKDKQIASVVGDGDHLGCVFVSSPTIKTLNVNLLLGCRRLKITAPSLVYLKVKNCYWQNFTSLGTMASLIEARFSLIRDWVKYAEHYINYLAYLKSLNFSTDFLEKIVSISELDSRVRFDNFTKQKLHFLYDFDKIVTFSRTAVNLEVLSFSMDGSKYTYRKPILVPMWLRECYNASRLMYL